MARKKLLTEGEIRQFMKLANLRPIGKQRLSEMGDHMAGARDDEDEDDELRRDLDATEDELGDEDRVADEEGAELDAMDDEMAMDDMGGDPEKEQMLADVVMAVADALGISDQVDVEGAPGDDEVEMDAEVELGPDGGEEVAMALDVEDDDELPGGRDVYQESLVAEIVKRLKEEQKYGGNEGDIPDADRKKKGHYGRGGKTKETAKEEGEEDFKKKDESVDSQEAIVNEVAKRVAARLQAESRKEQMVDTLAERIMKRLTK